MAGHSQFKNIMHRKAAQDKKKTKVFTKLMRDIVSAVRGGSPNPADNPVLKAAMDRARAANMTKDVVERAIKRGTGELKGDDYIERTYEGYGPGGVAILVRTLTDNPTRTITNVRTAFSKYGGNVGTDGSVAWMFKPCGLIAYARGVGTEDAVMERAIDAGADDVRVDDDAYRIVTSPADFAAVRQKLAENMGEPEESDLTFLPVQMQVVTDADTAANVMKVIDALDADEDVQDIITNFQAADSLA